MRRVLNMWPIAIIIAVAVIEAVIHVPNWVNWSIIGVFWLVIIGLHLYDRKHPRVTRSDKLAAALEEQIRERQRVEAKLVEQRRRITDLNNTLQGKNRLLDALHMVWCSGGCPSGVHRWSDEPVTEEIVKAAELNTLRLRTWYDAARFRLDTYPQRGEWYERNAERIRDKIGE